MFLPKALYSFFPKMPGFPAAARRSVNWMHNGLPQDPLWEPIFYFSMMYGVLINQVFPRVYSKEEFAQIKARTLLILGEKEAIYNSLYAAIRSARKLIPGLEVEMIANAHHIAALAQPEKVNQRLLRFFAE
jgi:pimeloyl-ACP methyl ester carboxylesterase